jgi:L-lactate dehydrogenase complex protein LldG
MAVQNSGEAVMSSARSAILDRVRRAQRTGRIPRSDAAGPHGRHQGVAGLRSQVTEAIVSGARMLERFEGELAQLGVTVHVEDTPDAVRQRVAAIVAGRLILAWDAACLPYDVARSLPNAATGASPRVQQAAADVGVTGCDAAIAETGSLMLLSGAGKPRTASLLPPLHVAIVRRADLRFSMAECLRERAADISAAACCTFITGPSRTADIELTLTLGVHGPGRVAVIVGP